MSSQTNYENYLASEPLTADLAALRRGEFPAPGLQSLMEAFGPRPAPAGENDRPLSREECLTLKEAQQAGGVTTLMRLLHKSLRAKVEAAKMDSENDPLGRGDEIARGWAYVAVYRRICLEVEGMILQAIASLENDAERGK